MEGGGQTVGSSCNCTGTAFGQHLYTIMLYYSSICLVRPVSCKSKKVQVPSSAISRVIGRGGCNINLIREVSGAHIEVEKQRGSGERVITIK